ncbi:hypothetical protein [Pseudonocardia sp. GCM10023141]|uniref:hypothetical protein n=1 Tax=Pseudonocardia sp. GCM10023141 TaxID=3252653 RepID=UPI003615829F
MSYTVDALDEVRAKIAASDTVLAEARNRLRLVREIASTFPGALRTYASGSIAQFTVNHPVSDGDGGLVLNRRCYPALGPDGGGEAPQQVVLDLCALLAPKLRADYRAATCHKSKRGPKLHFAVPIQDQDPTVDLVVGLTRRDGNGLWIPNLEDNTWEASDPEKHVLLLNTGTVALVRLRRRVNRLVKAWNKQFTEPGFSSHNLSMLAYECVAGGQNLADALAGYFAYAAEAVAAGDIEDPAGVSVPIKLLIPRVDAVRRLRLAAAALDEALVHDDDQQAVRAALAKVYWNYDLDSASGTFAGAVNALRRSPRVTTATLGLGGPATVVRPTRAYGGASR